MIVQNKVGQLIIFNINIDLIYQLETNYKQNFRIIDLQGFTGYMRLNFQNLEYNINFSLEKGLQLLKIKNNNNNFFYPNRDKTGISHFSIINNKILGNLKFDDSKQIEPIQEKEEEYFIVALSEGLKIYVLSTNGEQNNYQYKRHIFGQELQKNEAEASYVFDSQFELKLIEQKNAIQLNIFIATQQSYILIIQLEKLLNRQQGKFNDNFDQNEDFNFKMIQSQQVKVNFLNKPGISNMLISEKELFISTFENQLLIMSRKKRRELIRFSYHTQAISTLLFHYQNNNTQQKIKNNNSEHFYDSNSLNILENQNILLNLDNLIQNKKSKNEQISLETLRKEESKRYILEYCDQQNQQQTEQAQNKNDQTIQIFNQQKPCNLISIGDDGKLIKLNLNQLKKQNNSQKKI
ncbi:hypothetical protein PPERSA_11318 [Pseudocohnilembus persalinus]|uniref:Uncharacterized protein n=1 Tax=Pseudocohnilembus persalinus TaxID=266149 RepID=A0A0V0QPP1_PSEPJ|nr:hypothetical protein PPERSA_11318 [Pseudocohnilembus persalinus]|eukprot:KRX04194.1 hypothetical protein PPERSA_11318 [Pseudocohnilembus persalinus]